MSSPLSLLEHRVNGLPSAALVHLEFLCIGKLDLVASAMFKSRRLSSPVFCCFSPCRDSRFVIEHSCQGGRTWVNRC